MNEVSSYISNDVIFGFNLKDGVNRHLQQAARNVSDSEKTLEALKNAQRVAPDQLETLIALYKYHFYRGETAEAEDIVFQTLIKASLQGGFDYDWKTLNSSSADWIDPRGPGRVFLYSLKALAFIRLRQDDIAEAKSILEAMHRIDPEDHVGAKVIAELTEGLSDDD